MSERTERQFSHLERQYAEVAITTAGSWAYLSRIIDFPARPSAVLDIGGGGSDVTDVLLKRGYRAFAIDPRYIDPSLIEEKVRESYTKRDPNSPLRQYWNQLTREQDQALVVFNHSVRQNPSNYIPATATALPFKDETFDLVFSVNAVTEYLDLNKHLLQTTVSECLRVTKPSGRIELHPVKIVPPDPQKVEMAEGLIIVQKLINYRNVFKKLGKEGIKYELLPMGGKAQKLVIYKD